MFISYYVLVFRDNVCVGERSFATKSDAIQMILNGTNNRYGDNNMKQIQSEVIDIYFSSRYCFIFTDITVVLLEHMDNGVIGVHSYLGTTI